MTSLCAAWQVRDSPVYHRIKAKILESKGELDEALAVLEAGMKVPGVKSVVRGAPPVALEERASLYIQVLCVSRASLPVAPCFMRVSIRSRAAC